MDCIGVFLHDIRNAAAANLLMAAAYNQRLCSDGIRPVTA